jgi:hypothetical protein
MYATALYACEGQVELVELEEKFYLAATQICFTEDKIYIDANGTFYETPAIHADEAGYYVERVSKKASCSWYEWKCSQCQRCNLKGIDWKCKQCKKPIEE